jgi:hypothetical protein
VERPRHVLGQAVGLLHLGHPLGHAERAGAEEMPVVELLEGLAVALITGHLAHEHHQGRRVLECRVDTDRRIGGARASRHEADTGAPAQLALRVGHERGAAFLPAGDEADAIAMLVQAVQHGQVALAGHTVDGVHALGDQRFDQGMAGKS